MKKAGVGSLIKGAKKLGMKAKVKMNERRMKKQLKKAGYDPEATSGPKTLSATIARSKKLKNPVALPKYLKGKKFDDPDFYDLIDKNEIKKKSLGGIFRGKGALLPLFGLAGIAKYMDQNRKSSTVQPAKEVKPITMGEEATGVSKEETEGMSQGGMARGGGSAIRGTKFKGVF